MALVASNCVLIRSELIFCVVWKVRPDSRRVSFIVSWYNLFISENQHSAWNNLMIGSGHFDPFKLYGVSLTKRLQRGRFSIGLFTTLNDSLGQGEGGVNKDPTQVHLGNGEWACLMWKQQEREHLLPQQADDSYPSGRSEGRQKQYLVMCLWGASPHCLEVLKTYFILAG